MEKRQTSLEHGVRKSNSVGKKKKLHRASRKITDEQNSGSVKTNSSKFIYTRMETASSNTSGKIMDSLSENFKLVDAKFLKGKSRNIIKHNNEAPSTKETNSVNEKSKTSIKKIGVSKINYLSLIERRKKVDCDDLLSRKAIVKQQGKKCKILKKSVKNKIQGNSCNTESLQGKCVNELQVDAQSNGQENCKSFLQKSNLVKIDSPGNKALPQGEENMGGEVSTANGFGKRNKRGKLIQKKKSIAKCKQSFPHSAVDYKLLNKNIEKEEIISPTSSSSETSVNSVEEEIENSSENSFQMCSAKNDDSFGSINSPICVEMHEKNDDSSDLFKKSLQSYQMHAAKRVFSEKEHLTWKQSKIPAPNQWKISIGSTVLKTVQNNDKDSEGNFLEDHNVDSGTNTFIVIKLEKDKILMVLYPHQTAYFLGVYRLRVLWGAVDVLGYRIEDNKESHTIYSPWKFDMFGIHACKEFQNGEKEYYDELEKTVLREYRKVDRDFLYTVPVSSCFILLEPISDTLSLFFNKYYEECFSLFRDEDMFAVSNRRFYSPQQLLNTRRTLVERKEWIDLSKCFMHNPGGRKIMVCGGKGVGKSSFLRFLSNQMISSRKRLLYIDLDPGQCEFTPPGCVSAVVVKQPLLGPNFTHLTRPVRCIYIGRVDISKCPLEYMQSVELLLQWCTSNNHLRGVPWVINTMGFSHGMGVDLTIACIKLVCPTDVVHIRSSMKTKNFPFKLECTRVNETSTNTLISSKGIKVNYEFHSFLSEERTRSDRLPKPSELREMAVLAYFSEAVEKNDSSKAAEKYDSSWAGSFVHKLGFETLKLCVCHEKVNYSFYLSAMNANVVGLCDVGDSHGLIPTDPSYPEIWTSIPISNCYGMGIVRGVDMENKKIYIISPLSKTTMKRVNCLALGAVYLPDQFYTLQESGHGIFPYVTEGHGLTVLKDKKLDTQTENKKLKSK